LCLHSSVVGFLGSKDAYTKKHEFFGNCQHVKVVQVASAGIFGDNLEKVCGLSKCPTVAPLVVAPMIMVERSLLGLCLQGASIVL